MSLLLGDTLVDSSGLPLSPLEGLGLLPTLEDGDGLESLFHRQEDEESLRTAMDAVQQRDLTPFICKLLSEPFLTSQLLVASKYWSV